MTRFANFVLPLAELPGVVHRPLVGDALQDADDPDALPMLLINL